MGVSQKKRHRTNAQIGDGRKYGKINCRSTPPSHTVNAIIHMTVIAHLDDMCVNTIKIRVGLLDVVISSFIYHYHAVNTDKDSKTRCRQVVSALTSRSSKHRPGIQ